MQSSRLGMLNNQLKPSQCLNNGRVGAKDDEDIVIVGMARTALTSAKRGPFKNTAPEAMLAPVMKASLEQAGIEAKELGDIVIGNVL